MATYYVSKSNDNSCVVGSDSNNGTSRTSPWLTLAKVSASAADGDTIYVNNGVYTDAELGGSNVFSLNTTKSLKMYPLQDYAVTLQSTAASAQIVSLTGTATNEMIFGKFVIDAEIPGAPGTYQPTCMVIPNTAGDCTLTLAGTKFKNAATQNILNSRRRGIMNFNVVFEGRIAQGVASTTSGADVATLTVNVTGVSLVNCTVSANALCRILDFTRLSTSSQTFTLTVQNVTGTIEASSGVGSSVAIALLVTTGIAGVVAEQFDVTYTCFNAGATCYGIYIKNASRGATAVADRPIIRNNRITGNAPSEYVISIGDTTTAYNVDYGMVYGNTITVPYYASATPHAIAIGNVTGGFAYGNRINGAYVGILLGINQGAIVTGNVSVGCYGYAFYAKGCGATTPPVFCQNTAILANTYGPARGAGFGVAVQGATNNAAVTFQNNIVYALSDLYRFAEVGISQIAAFVQNNYYSAGPVGFTSPFAYQASTYTTLALWKAAQETTALNVDPIFVSPTDFRLQSASPLKRAGTFISNSCRDFRGRPCFFPSDLGAYQSGSGDPANTRSTRN